MLLQVQIENCFFRSWPDLYGFSQGGDGDAFGEIALFVAPVIKEHRDLGKADEIAVLPCLCRGREIDMPEVSGDHEGHATLIGRAGFSGGEHAEFLTGEQPQDDCPGVRASSCFHCPIFDESPSFVNTGPLDSMKAND